MVVGIYNCPKFVPISDCRLVTRQRHHIKFYEKEIFNIKIKFLIERVTALG